MSDVKYTLHTHTVGFDGQNTIAEMVVASKRLGFSTIGISNHFIVHPNIKDSVMYRYAVMGKYDNIYSASFQEALDKFAKHYDEIEKVRAQYPQMQILRGMEVDFFNNSQWLAGFDKVIQYLKPDYLIGSAHFIEHNGLLLNTHDWRHADADMQKDLLETYWTNVANAASSGLFNWLAHLDLPKKVGLGGEDKWAIKENDAIDAAAKSKTAIEINTSFYDRADHPYPSVRILEMAKAANVPVLISDDAHNVNNLGRHFDKAEQLIRELKLKRFEEINAK